MNYYVKRRTRADLDDLIITDEKGHGVGHISRAAWLVLLDATAVEEFGVNGIWTLSHQLRRECINLAVEKWL